MFRIISQKVNLRVIFIIFILSMTSACMTTPAPQNSNDVCAIFKQYPKWYWATKSSEQRWRVPIAVQMAIIHQESSFKAKAKPPRTKLLWIIPWKRPSSSYGYTQALDTTWEHYKKSAGKSWVNRNDFSDSADFIGWYGYMANRKAGIPRNNAYKLYLAYHEGVGGYQRRTYLKKQWLISVAHKVQRNANRYQSQLNRCQSRLPTKPWYRFW